MTPLAVSPPPIPVTIVSSLAAAQGGDVEGKV